MSRLNISKFLSVTASLILLSSCANMQAMLEEQVQEEKEISVEQKLQVSIPIPDNSKYLINKTKFNIISLDNYSTGSKKNEIKNKRIKYIKSDTKSISKNLNLYKKSFNISLLYSPKLENFLNGSGT